MGEICAGVVKAQKLFCKNPAQHFADLLMVENKPESLPFRTTKQADRKKLNVLELMVEQTKGLCTRKSSIGGPRDTYKKETRQS